MSALRRILFAPVWLLAVLAVAGCLVAFLLIAYATGATRFHHPNLPMGRRA